VSVFAKSLFAFVLSNFGTLTFFTAWHIAPLVYYDDCSIALQYKDYLTLLKVKL